MSPPSYLALLLLVASIHGVLAEDIDENIAAAVFGALIVIFAIIGIIFLIMIIRLRRKLRQRNGRDQPDVPAVKSGIVRYNTDRGIVGFTKRQDSSLVPIVENAEEAEDVVPNYDSLSHTSAYYEKVNEPNPAYQQYRKQSESIPVSMMNPKHSEQTVENALYSDVAVLLPDEDEPSTTISFMPGSETNRYKDEAAENALYSTADDVLYSSADKNGKPVTSNTTNKDKPAAIAEAADNEPPIYAVPIKKSSRVKKPDYDTGEKSDKSTDQWVTPEVDSASTAPQQDSGPDMSIFVSKSQTKLDSEPPNVPPTSDTDNVSDDMLNGELPQKGHSKLENRDSIMSTTSDDRDLLNSDVKLRGRPKKSQPKPKTVAAKGKFTSSPKVNGAHQAKSIPSNQDKSKQPSDQTTSKLSSHANVNQQQSQVKRFGQPQQASTKPPTGNKPKIDASLFQASPKLKPSDSHLSAMATNQQGSGRTSPNLRNMRLHPNISSQPQGNPLQPLKDRSSPRTQRKGASVDSALQNKPVNQTISQQGKSQTQLTQSRPTSQHQASPLQQLRNKSSPRAKPKNAAAPARVTPQQQAQSYQPPTTSSQQQSMTKAMNEAHKRSSIATETPSQPASLGLSKPAEKQRPKSAVTVDETVSKTSSITRNTGITVSYKDKRKQEAQDLDDTFKDFDDFLTSI
ncbi:nucleolar and coiled-body phosphoprotein 1-like isoform X2 [Dysidea avara]|uniref:nucleolar and coiled-body phosphoprotein 1-like isoform X2 n=1 Tax=Dysidea avara TaxID=196820 RepID=UPI00331F3636